MKLRLYLGMIALLFALQTGAAELSDQGAAELDSYLQEAIATTHIPGLVALVVNKDGIIYEKAFGLMDSANNKPMTTDAIFQLFSMTKPVTSTAVMMLVEEGKIKLDDPASEYLPALANARVMTSWNAADGTYSAAPAKNVMTVRHLLTHTSGLGYSFTSEILNKLTNGDFNARATAYPLLFEPGTRWLYGESTRVLGEMVQAVSGQELFDFMKARILDPLHMVDTTYDVPAEKNMRVITSHQYNGTAMTETPNPAGIISFAHLGDAGLHGTARDYAQFIRLFLNGGSVNDSGRLLKRETVALMGQNHTAPVKVELMHSANKTISEDFPLGAGVDSFGLGFQRAESQVPGMRSVGSLSWAGAANTEFWIDPQKEIGAVLLMQFTPFYDATAIAVLQGFEQRIYQSLK
ncbi:MAG: Beta-lactamase protein [Gammaproteobacteria bacterium]|nr:Beta-lactamase protein [Gammaproteobacteria bacterium]